MSSPLPLLTLAAPCSMDVWDPWPLPSSRLKPQLTACQSLTSKACPARTNSHENNLRMIAFNDSSRKNNDSNTSNRNVGLLKPDS